MSELSIGLNAGSVAKNAKIDTKAAAKETTVANEQAVAPETKNIGGKATADYQANCPATLAAMANITFVGKTLNAGVSNCIEDSIFGADIVNAIAGEIGASTCHLDKSLSGEQMVAWAKSNLPKESIPRIEESIDVLTEEVG